MKAFIVVGAGYGDEGKGLTVDWLCEEQLKAGEKVVAARYNGGTQAAHTVQYADGSRIVWHNLNSATAQGVPTYLARRFIMNPIGLNAELQDPEKSKFAPVVYASPDCRVSLPVDMQLNQMMETLRTKRHGSCGWGIGETVERSLKQDLEVTAGDLATITVEQVEVLTRAYLAIRLPALGVDQLLPEWEALLYNKAVWNAFVQDCHAIAGRVQLKEEECLPDLATTLVFEGAQGLGLCEDGEHFPHVTRSKTGCQWALQTLNRMGKDHPVTALEVIYVTRAYATRHGAGPLEREGHFHGCRVEDATNVPNEWQGALRTAPLDCDVLTDRVYDDLAWAQSFLSSVKFSMMMTHVDCVTAEYNYYTMRHPDTLDRGPQQALGYIAAKARVLSIREGRNTRSMRLIQSTGPTRQNVEVFLEDEKDMMARAARVVPGMGAA